jgi:ABC-type multidrug transport system permease subunit
MLCAAQPVYRRALKLLVKQGAIIVKRKDLSRYFAWQTEKSQENLGALYLRVSSIMILIPKTWICF